MSKHLSAAEIDALLTSLRRAQDGSPAAPRGAEEPGRAAPPRIPPRTEQNRQPAAGAQPGGPLPIRDVELEASVYVGGGVYRLAALAALRPGAVLPLATEVGEPAVIAIGDRVIAYGEIMVTEEDTLAVRLTRVVLGKEGRHAAPAWLEGARHAGSERPAPPPPPGRPAEPAR